MGYKVFVSYKYADDTVFSIGEKHTVRDYVNFLQNKKFSGDDLNKAENDNEDLSDFKDDTIQTHLKTKIWDSSITIVLISPNMKDRNISEENQWIPWEISYSLKSVTRFKRRSQSNGILAVVLPDITGDYSYFVKPFYYVDNFGKSREATTIYNSSTFSILSKNMFNEKSPNIQIIQGEKIYFGNYSYILVVRWDRFISNIDLYLDKASFLRNCIDDYNITKTIL